MAITARGHKVKISEGNAIYGTVREVRVDEAVATIRIQFGEDILESVIPKAADGEYMHPGREPGHGCVRIHAGR
jgi:hypothetical protein